MAAELHVKLCRYGTCGKGSSSTPYMDMKVQLTVWTSAQQAISLHQAVLMSKS